MHPYRLQLLQELHESDKEQRLQIGIYFRYNEHQLNFIFWSDEANFYLNSDISRYHCGIWSRSKPHDFLTKSLHPLKVTVLFGFTLQFCVTT